MIQEIEVSKLNQAAYNPRKELQPDSFEWGRLKDSLVKFGTVEPIIWNRRTGNVIGGHQRLAVLKSLGFTSVPCQILDMDLKQEKLLNVALNKIRGRWDDQKLEDLIAGLDAELAAMTGFSGDELALLLASDDDIDPWDGEDDSWQGGSSPSYENVSFVVTLVFDSMEEAAAWLEIHFPAQKFTPGSHAKVIRMEG